MAQPSLTQLQPGYKLVSVEDVIDRKTASSPDITISRTSLSMQLVKNTTVQRE